MASTGERQREALDDSDLMNDVDEIELGSPPEQQVIMDESRRGLTPLGVMEDKILDQSQGYIMEKQMKPNTPGVEIMIKQGVAADSVSAQQRFT